MVLKMLDTWRIRDQNKTCQRVLCSWYVRCGACVRKNHGGWILRVRRSKKMKPGLWYLSAHGLSLISQFTELVSLYAKTKMFGCAFSFFVLECWSQQCAKIYTYKLIAVSRKVVQENRTRQYQKVLQLRIQRKFQLVLLIYREHLSFIPA